GMANLFARVRTKNAPNGHQVIFAASEGEVVQPLTGQPQPPRPLDRHAMADWLVSRDNPYFGRAIVNRVWANFLGVGLVEAVDDMRKTNPASNEKLLTALADHLAKEKFDLKEIGR